MIEIFKGENKGFAIRVKNNSEQIEVFAVSIVRAMREVTYSYTLEDGTLSYDNSNQAYIFELTSEQTSKMLTTTYAIEAKVTTVSGTTIRPLAEIMVLPNKVNNI